MQITILVFTYQLCQLMRQLQVQIVQQLQQNKLVDFQKSLREKAKIE